MQVGCGSVGLMRTASSAATDGPAAMNHADTYARFPDVDVAHLLIDQLFRDGFLRVALELG